MKLHHAPALAPTQIAPGLFCFTESGPKNQLRHYSYFLIRPEGNLLFHPLKKTSVLRRYEDWFSEQGGVDIQVLTHGAEASRSCDWIYKRFGAGLHFHVSDTSQVARKTSCPVARAFSSGHQVGSEVIALPLSGHTLGFTAYKIKVPKRTFLVTGDFLMPTGSAWIARVRKGLMSAGIANLNAMKAIDFDAVLPNMSKGPSTPPFALSLKERIRAIDEAVDRFKPT
jgi:glyoxylase-like metal-dependent hydrolase (beta-lactamase superfamily II)